ncbi:hypothetical protein OG216_01035 [Streptomycetaceae bacterium NBC_01309]
MTDHDCARPAAEERDPLVAELVATMLARADTVTPPLLPYARFRREKAARRRRVGLALAASATALALVGGTAWAGYGLGKGDAGPASGSPFDEDKPRKVTEECGEYTVLGQSLLLLSGAAKAKAEQAIADYVTDDGRRHVDRSLVYSLVCQVDLWTNGGVDAVDVRVLWGGVLPTGPLATVLSFSRGNETMQFFSAGMRAFDVMRPEHQGSPWLLAATGGSTWAVFATPGARVELQDRETGRVLASGTTDQDGFVQLAVSDPTRDVSTSIVNTAGARVSGPSAPGPEIDAVRCRVLEGRDTCPPPGPVDPTMPPLENWEPKN